MLGSSENLYSCHVHNIETGFGDFFYFLFLTFNNENVVNLFLY